MKRIVAAACALLVLTQLLAPVALADGLPTRSRVGAPEAPTTWNWTGIYASLGVGGLASIYDLDLVKVYGDEAVPLASLNGLGAWGFAGDGRIGVDYQPSPMFVVGPFVGYGFGSTEVDASVGGTTIASLELTPTWNVGVRAGVVGPNKSLIYVGYRYQEADLDIRVGGERASDTVGSHGAIAGLEIPITAAFTMALEYGYQPYDIGDLVARFDPASSLKINTDADVHSVMLRGNVRIGPNLF
jgi:outer membrane protein with beta-barrel domain